MSIELSWSRHDGVVIARPVGRIYSSNYLEWQTELESGVTADDTALLVDFEEVPYLSSAGLRVLLTVARRFDKPGGGFALCRLKRTVRKVLAASGLDNVVKVYGSEAEALAAITGGAGDADA